jgi:hypothetical protein
MLPTHTHMQGGAFFAAVRSKMIAARALSSLVVMDGCAALGRRINHISLLCLPFSDALNLLRHRLVADGGVGARSSASKNKVAVLGFLSRQYEDLRMLVLLDLAGVSSFGRLHR